MHPTHPVPIIIFPPTFGVVFRYSSFPPNPPPYSPQKKNSQKLFAMLISVVRGIPNLRCYLAPPPNPIDIYLHFPPPTPKNQHRYLKPVSLLSRKLTLHPFRSKTFISSSMPKIPNAQYTLVPGLTVINLRSLLSFGGPFSPSLARPLTRSSTALALIVLVYGGPRPISAAFIQLRSQPLAISADVCQPVRRATSRNLVMVQPRCAASRYWTPAWKSAMHVSMSAAPWRGLRVFSVETGWRPAQMRPMVLAQPAVRGAATPAAIMAAGGMEGWQRAVMMRPV